jgi:integrase
VPEYRLVRHRGKFSLAFNEPGRGRVRVALGTDDRGEAEARARELWRARNAPIGDKVANLWDAYVTDRKANVARTDRFDSLWAALSPNFGHRIGSAITRDDCKAYAKIRERAGKRPSTIKTELEFLRACLRFHYGPKAPAVWVPQESKPRDRWLTKDEAKRLLDAIETPHVRLFVELALGTGARMSAILDLTWDRVDWRSGTIDFNPAGREITNKRRVTVPMSARVRAAMEEAQKAALTDHVIEYGGKPVASVKKAIQAAARRSGVPCSPHVFRHTAGVWLAEADVPMQKIAQYLGHTSTRVTERVYARYSPSYMRDAAAALDW